MHPSLFRSTALKLAARASLAVTALAGLTIVCRALAGPFTLGIRVNSPLNAEGCFALGAILLILLRSHPAAGTSAGADRNRLRDSASLLSAAFLAVFAFAGSLHDFFLSDDFVMLRHAREFVFDPRTLLRSGGGDGFFRPLVYASFASTLPWAGSDPLCWHALALALHILNTSLVYALARSMDWPRGPAWLASLLFAIHASRPETVVWITGRFDLLATLFTLATLVLFLRSWRGEGRPWIWRTLALLTMLAALLCKESAYACPLLLALLCAPGRGDSIARRIWALAPFFLAAALLFAYRWILFGGVGGYLTRSGAPQVLSVSALSIARALAFRIWAILFFPINWSAALGLALALSMAAYCFALVWLACSGIARPKALGALAFAAIAAIPPAQQLLISQDLEKARYLYLPSVGYCLLLAALVETGGARRWLPAAAIVLFHLAALSHNRFAWDGAAAKSRAVCQAVASCPGPAKVSGLPPILHGVYFFQNGFRECVEMENVEESRRPANATGPGGCVLEWNSQREALERR